MFARVRRATDLNDDSYGLREDWTASIEQITRAMREQAPIHGLAGISEGGAAASILVTRSADDFGPGFYG